ncbi:hypothetical protein V6N13_040413 [Hibiscus sabdariffa]|uniref:Uncharacterized protein n=1 Tax=Hibiscus sabdariffa TaxID=183260 RepID=A0ABR2R8F1_9ROSI
MEGPSPESLLGGASSPRPLEEIYWISEFPATVSRDQPKLWVSKMLGMEAVYWVGIRTRPVPKIRPGALSNLVDFFLEIRPGALSNSVDSYLEHSRPTLAGPLLLVLIFGDHTSITGPCLLTLTWISS